MDGLIYATSIVMLDSARPNYQSCPSEVGAGTGIAATLAAAVVHDLGNGRARATAAARPTAAPVGSYDLLMMIIRSAAGPPEQSARPRETHDLRHVSASITASSTTP